MKKNVVFDFDGVIHSYSSGWCGIDKIIDPPVRGIKTAIANIRKAGYKVIVVSTRCAEISGLVAVENWLKDNNIIVDEVTNIKPPALCYIDDRAICFNGKPETLLDQIENFVPWNRK